jgi:hypothetical protein
MITGLSMFAAGYVGSLATLALNPEVFDEKLMIPVAGPILSHDDLDRASVPSDQKDLDHFTLYLQTGLQGVGLVLGTVGVALFAGSKPSSNAAAEVTSVALLPTSQGMLASAAGRF